jgi:rod shape-determining protein MreC
MAPPRNRRPGYSRRAYNSIFFAYVAAAAGVLLGAVLLASSMANPGGFATLRGLGNDLVQPVARGAADLRGWFADGWDVLCAYATWGPENARLQREVALARVKSVESAALADENRRLKALLQLADDTPKPVANAWLVASTSGNTRRYATISAGARAGVRPGMPVRAPLGLVGRVLEVGQFSARVLMITDTQSVVPVRRASDGLPAFATGKGDGTLQLRLLTLGINPLKPGDAFVTSGSGGLYWPGTPIAVVSSLTRDGAIARVLGDPTTSDAVAVQPQWAPEADPTLPEPAENLAPNPLAKTKKKAQPE